MLPIVLLKRLTRYRSDFGVEREHFRSLWFYNHFHDDYVKAVNRDNPFAYTFKDDMRSFLIEK
jgi:hypothetical protein